MVMENLVIVYHRDTLCYAIVEVVIDLGFKGLHKDIVFICNK